MAQTFLKPITACFGKPVAENPTQVMIEATYRERRNRTCPLASDYALPQDTDFLLNA